MKSCSLSFYILFLVSLLAGCSPEQKDADESLSIIPPKRLSPQEIAILGDTSTCVFTTATGRVLVTLDSNLNIIPSPRGYYDFTAEQMPWDYNAVELLHSSFGSYEDRLRLAFYNYNTSSYGLREGVYGVTSVYGNGRVEFTGKYMTNGFFGERGISPIGNPKIYVKRVTGAISGYDIIFCNVKMSWQYMNANKYYYTPVTLNGKVFVND